MVNKSVKKYKHIHFIGIKGVAMAALAVMAKQSGIKVTGSDTDEDFPTKEILKKFNITPLVGFKKENITGKPDLVVVTGAHYGVNNPEAQAANKMGLRVLMHGQALAEFMQGKKGIAVAGSHGKTTVAAMIAHILAGANLDPSFAIGCGDIKSLGVPGHAGKGEFFVVEADEYINDPGQDPTPRFLYLNPQIAVITNIDYDHPDAYRNIDEVIQAFQTFANKVPHSGLLVVGIDDINARRIIPLIKTPVLTYGFFPLADFKITRVSFTDKRTWFHLLHQGIDLGQFSLLLPGRVNVLNAAAALIVTNYLGISWEKIRQVLPLFLGTKRRFEAMGEKNRVKFFDDYAHHPTQIRSTLEAVRSWYPEARIFCIFQPHTYSRTKALFNQFSRAFTQADQVIITDIYASAREEPDPTVNSRLLTNEVGKFHRHTHYFAKIDEIIDFIKKETIPGDVVITMGAGDIYKLYDNLGIKRSDNAIKNKK